MPEITSETRGIDELFPHVRNYNQHGKPGVIDRMANKIRHTAFTAPIICTPDGVILGGHLRRLALLKLRSESYPEPKGVEPGWRVPVRVFRGTEAQELAVLAADNPDPADIDFDNEGLASLLSELADAGELEATGYSAERLDELIGELVASGEGNASDSGLLPDADPDAIPESAPTRCQPGDLWRLGNHRLLCGDSTKAEDAARLMGGEKAGAVITDPPYGIGGSGMTMGSKQSSLPRAQRLSAGQEWDNERPDISHLLDAAEWVCIWGGNYFADSLPPTNHWLCWHKKNDGLSFSEFELAWTNYGKQCRHLSHHWGREEKQHITQKPMAVMVFSIERCPASDAIYDPYSGSGTTLIAAESLGRKCYGMEISPAYCDIILTRWEALTGKTAELLERITDGPPSRSHAPDR